VRVSAFIHVNDSSFNQVVQDSPVPVLVEFGAEWCGPCRQMEPVIEQFAAAMKGKLRLAKIDVDESVNLTMQFQVMSVPTLILFHKGEAVQRASGNQPRSRLEEKFAPFIENVKPGG